MQDSNPQADGNAEARSRDEWRSDRSADTVLRDGGADTDSGGRRRGSERVGRGGVGERERGGRRRRSGAAGVGRGGEGAEAANDPDVRDPPGQVRRNWPSPN